MYSPTSSKPKWGMSNMSDINTDSMAIAPGVVETIITLAVRDVAGVASVGSAPSGIRSLLSFNQSAEGVKVNVSEDNSVEVSVSLRVFSGFSLNEIADNVRAAVADAVLSQVGLTVSRVDIRVDGITFTD